MEQGPDVAVGVVVVEPWVGVVLVVEVVVEKQRVLY
jgi:hypothetical protein